MRARVASFDSYFEIFKIPELARAMWRPWIQPEDGDEDLLGDIWDGRIIQEKIKSGVIQPGDVLLLGNKDGFLPLGKQVKYSCTPSLFLILNIGKRNRLHPFWIFLTYVIPGPRKFPSEDAFLCLDQLEMELLNSGIDVFLFLITYFFFFFIQFEVLLIIR